MPCLPPTHPTNIIPSHRRTLTFAASILCYGLSACCGPNSSSNCSDTRIGPSGAEVYGTIIGVGAAIGVGVALEVNHSHHILKGCASSGPNGLELETGAKTYLLSGVTGDIKPGDRVRVHGSKLKQPKHSTGDQTFTVEKLNKDYGPCKVTHP